MARLSAILARAETARSATRPGRVALFGVDERVQETGWFARHGRSSSPLAPGPCQEGDGHAGMDQQQVTRPGLHQAGVDCLGPAANQYLGSPVAVDGCDLSHPAFI